MIRVCVVLSLVGCAGPQGERGPAGDAGPQGDPGEQGPKGDPGGEAPVLTRAWPTWGSALTRVTVEGTGLGTDATALDVRFDGFASPIEAVTATAVVTRPGVDADGSLGVTVARAGATSNPLRFDAVRSGTARTWAGAMPGQAAGVATLGTDIYVAADGLWRIDASGTGRRVVAPVWLPPLSDWDGPVAVASRADDVVFTTSLGAVHAYDPVTHDVIEVLAPRLEQLDDLGGARSLAADGDRLYVLDDNASTETSPHAGILVVEGEDVTVWPAPAGATSIAAGSGRVFVAGFQIVELDPDDGAATPFGDVAGYVGALAFDGDHLWAASSEIRRVPLNGGASTVYAVPVSGSPVGVAPAPGGGVLFLDDVPGTQLARYDPDPTVVFASHRLALGAVAIGDRLYVAGGGVGLLDADDPVPGDGTVLELGPDTVRVVATGDLFTGIAVDGDTLLVADCGTRRVDRLDPVTRIRTPLLDGDDVGCPAGLATHGGTTWVLDSGVFADTPSTVVRHTQSGVTRAFVTGLPSRALSLALSGDRLVFAGVDGADDLVSIGLYGASTQGGAASLLATGDRSQILAVATGPDDRIIGMRPGFLFDVDADDGALAPIGPWALEAGDLALALGVGTGPGGNLVVGDLFSMTEVAP